MVLVMLKKLGTKLNVFPQQYWLYDNDKIHANALFSEVREVSQEALGSLDTWKTNHIATRQKKLTLKFLGWRSISKKGWQVRVPLNQLKSFTKSICPVCHFCLLREIQHIQTFKDLIPTNHGLIHFPQPVLFFHSFGSKAHNPPYGHPKMCPTHELPQSYILHDQQTHLSICMNLLSAAQWRIQIWSRLQRNKQCTWTMIV